MEAFKTLEIFYCAMYRSLVHYEFMAYQFFLSFFSNETVFLFPLQSVRLPKLCYIISYLIYFQPFFSYSVSFEFLIAILKFSPFFFKFNFILYTYSLNLSF